jgi:hypothetical protein
LNRAFSTSPAIGANDQSHGKAMRNESNYILRQRRILISALETRKGLIANDEALELPHIK